MAKELELPDFVGGIVPVVSIALILACFEIVKNRQALVLHHILLVV